MLYIPFSHTHMHWSNLSFYLRQLIPNLLKSGSNTAESLWMNKLCFGFSKPLSSLEWHSLFGRIATKMSEKLGSCPSFISGGT